MQADQVDASIDWNRFRQQMPVAERWAYFDHAAVAPISGPAQAAMNRWVAQSAGQGDTIWPEWGRQVERVRELAASTIGAEGEEVALVPNTTAGIALVAEGYPWRRGDNVVTLANEFPSNQYPWINLASRGVETRCVPVDDAAVDLNRLAEACDARTRIVSVSWVGYATGWRLDLDEVSRVVHDRGALLFLDAIQGLGVFPIDVRRTGIDFLAADGHKWMLGPEGAGLAFVRREHLDLLRPIGVGWHSVVDDHDFARIHFELRPEAARYEGGSQNMPGMIGLGASLQLLCDFGLSSTDSPIARRVLELTDLASGRLAQLGARIVSRRDGEHRSGNVAFELPGRDPEQIRRKCIDANVALSCRTGRLRISPHAYNNEDDIDRLIAVLKT